MSVMVDDQVQTIIKSYGEVIDSYKSYINELHSEIMELKNTLQGKELTILHLTRELIAADYYCGKASKGDSEELSKILNIERL